MDTTETDRGHNRYKSLLVDKKSHRQYARDTFYRALRRHAPDAMCELDEAGPPLIAADQMPEYALSEPETWANIAPLGPFVVAWSKAKVE